MSGSPLAQRRIALFLVAGLLLAACGLVFLYAEGGAGLSGQEVALARSPQTVTSTELKLRPVQESLRNSPIVSSQGMPTVGNAERGRKWVEKFECARCHESKLWKAPKAERDCAGCHRQIVSGTFDIDAHTLKEWQETIRHFVVVPSLSNTASRFRREWLVDYLLQPRDLRPGLEETMPRLAMSESEARDMAAFLTPEPGADSLPERGDRERGREAFVRKSCVSCHVLSALKVPLVAGLGVKSKYSAEAKLLAPDLRHVRERFRLENLVTWIMDPSSLHDKSRMPSLGVKREEAIDLAEFIVHSPLSESKGSLALKEKERWGSSVTVTRDVLFDEVNRRVFRKSCWHCHSDPDFAEGDGGPGNTGGLGFAGVGLDLSTPEGVLGGALPGGQSVTSVNADKEGLDSRSHEERSPIIQPDSPALSRLVRALRARKVEEGGGSVPGVRGMPLGLPSLSFEDIALVEAWIAQGAR